jgi:hypothetical protein
MILRFCEVENMICYKYFMASQFFESEKFRANIHLLIGTTLCSPFCIIILELLKDKKFCGYTNFSISFIMFMIGFLIINNSYNIMYKQEHKNE